MPSLRPLTEVIADIYEAALSSEGMRTLAPLLENSVAGGSGSILLKCARTKQLVDVIEATDNFDEKANKEYRARYYCRNPWISASLRMGCPVSIRSRDIISDESFAKTEFYSDWCRRIGIFHLIGSSQPVGSDFILATAIYRGRGERDFTIRERNRLGTLAWHLGRSIELAARLRLKEQAGRVSLDLLDALSVGVVLIDAHLRPVVTNATAERALAAGRWLSATGGRLRAVRHADARVVERLLAAVVAASEGRASISSSGTIRLHDTDARTLVVFAAPLRMSVASQGLPSAVAAVIFSDTQGSIDPDVVAKVFGLTRSEGAVLSALTAGHSLAQYAQKRGVSINTAKSQLSSIFAKTGHTRQATLIAEAVSHPVVRLASEDRKERRQ